MTEASVITIAAVSTALRQMANWGLSFDNGPAGSELRAIASKVEALIAEDDFCCPMCEEVECDDDCPLAAVRAELARN
jgi:hypothetical protein